jgi:hypothetical protein
MPTSLSSSRACSSVSRSSRRTNGVRRIEPVMRAFMRAWRPTWTFSSTVMVLKSLMFWNVRATPAWVTMCGALAVMSRPSKMTLPDVGL